VAFSEKKPLLNRCIYQDDALQSCPCMDFFSIVSDPLTEVSSRLTWWLRLCSPHPWRSRLHASSSSKSLYLPICSKTAPQFRRISRIQRRAYYIVRQWTPWPWHFLFQLIHLFWLAPIIVFLIFNLQNSVIGASVWCPFGKCASNAFNSDAIATAVKYNKTDHDTLAGL